MSPIDSTDRLVCRLTPNSDCSDSVYGIDAVGRRPWWLAGLQETTNPASVRSGSFPTPTLGDQVGAGDPLNAGLADRRPWQANRASPSGVPTVYCGIDQSGGSA